MKKKNHKQGNRRRRARHIVRTVPAKRRGSVKENKAERASAPWLRMVPGGPDDEPRAEDLREFLSHRNGRRQPRDLDLYTPEDNPRSR